MPKEITDQMYAWPLNIPETGELKIEIVLPPTGVNQCIPFLVFFFPSFHSLPFIIFHPHCGAFF
jgi:hypothetical protein